MSREREAIPAKEWSPKAMWACVYVAATIAEFSFALYFYFQWQKWEDAYWDIQRRPRNEEIKKTIVAPMFHSSKSWWND